MSRDLILRKDSLQYVTGTVTADHNLAGLPILVALPKEGSVPTSGEFVPTEVTGVTAGSDSWTASYRILVGPGGSLVPVNYGSYMWTVKVNDSAEDPVMTAGRVRVAAT